MALVELIMPKMGESIMEATILKWLKKPGDKIEQDESVLEVATDKVDTEVPSMHAGVLEEILAKEGEVIHVGKPIAVITTDSEVSQKASSPSGTPSKAEGVAKGPQGVAASATNGATHNPAEYKNSTR